MSDPTLVNQGEAEILRASIALRDDLIMRAEMNKHLNDGEIVVEASSGKWMKFCQAIDHLTAQGGKS